MRRLFHTVLKGVAAVFAIVLIVPESAAEKLRVGKGVPFAWALTPLDVGIQTGIFAGRGLEVEASAFAGDARLQQALAADGIDIGIGSGPAMAFMAKGVPAKAVFVMSGVPKSLGVMVGHDAPIKTVDDLRGKKLGVTTVGSLTEWIGKRINAQKGWTANGIVTVPIGGLPPARAAIKTGQLDGYIGAIDAGYALEESREWRVITGAESFVDDFITAVFFVRDEVIQKRPEAVRSFLRGWLDTIAFMKANRSKAIEITSQAVDISPSVAARAYDEQIGTFSEDGTFHPKAIAFLKQSLTDMGLLKDIPADSVMFTTRFVPVR